MLLQIFLTAIVSIFFFKAALTLSSMSTGVGLWLRLHRLLVRTGSGILASDIRCLGPMLTPSLARCVSLGTFLHFSVLLFPHM